MNKDQPLIPGNQSSPNRITLAKVGFIATTGFSMLLVLPIILGGLADLHQYSEVTLGWVAAVNSIGIALGGVIIPFIISKFRLIRLIRLGLIGLLITDGASLFIIEVEWFMSIRFLSGIAGGLIYATVLAGLAGIVKPERGFGIYVVVYCCWSGIGLFLSPYLLGVLGVAGVFLFLLFTTLWP